jgi:hypothetical protein
MRSKRWSIGRHAQCETATVADFFPHPSEVPLLTPTVRSHGVKLNGRAPNVNVCGGDSGGPIIVNQDGQDYVAGVASRTGPWCENISIHTRIDPYLPFLDTAYRKGGQEKLVPSLDCVDTRPGGTLVAYFGYKNDNGVSVTIPHGANNRLALDVTAERPTLFRPGNRRFQVGIDFTPGQTVTWQLNAPHGPLTTVSANATSLRCGDVMGLVALATAKQRWLRSASKSSTSTGSSASTPASRATGSGRTTAKTSGQSSWGASRRRRPRKRTGCVNRSSKPCRGPQRVIRSSRRRWIVCIRLRELRAHRIGEKAPDEASGATREAKR